MTDISIIIVNWNTRDLLRNCISSIQNTVINLNFEIIVVDNGSQDGSVAMLKEEFPRVVLIANSDNRGFAVANNQGFAVMTGRYALLLNTDACLTENAVRELFSFMEAHPEAGMACGQLLNADGSKQNSIANFPSIFTLLFNTPVLEFLCPSRFPSKRYQHKAPIEVDSGIGACLMVRKQAIDQVGGLDERYFFFFEETDWALEMHSAGWKSYHVPSALIYHLQGQSIGRNIRSRIEFFRSRYKFFRKWNSSPYCAVISVIVFSRLLVNWLLTSIANVISMGMIRGMRNKWIIYSQLIVWHFKGRP